MTKISESVLYDMQSSRARGDTYREIARRFGFNHATVYGRLYRNGSSYIDASSADPNANNKKWVTRVVYNNGGCSTLSGPVSVTLPRLSCLGEALTA